MLTVISCRCWSITRAEVTRQPFSCPFQMARLPHHLLFLVWNGKLRIFLSHHSSNWPCVKGKVELKFSRAEWLVAMSTVTLLSNWPFTSSWKSLLVMSWNKVERNISSLALRHIIQALWLQGDDTEFQEGMEVSSRLCRITLFSSISPVWRWIFPLPCKCFGSGQKGSLNVAARLLGIAETTIKQVRFSPAPSA